jgi:hypothetical protein
MAKSKTIRIGKLPPRYSFILNQYETERLSKCPKCRKLTHPRKFALFIHIVDWAPVILGKTCKYCSKCELIMAHQNELESELACIFERTALRVIGNDYLVIGTVEKKIWQQNLAKNTGTFGETLEYLADFKKYLTLHVEPGGWYRS